ncbi:MAG: signal peptidase II [Planctomycetota bacterium]
MIEGAAMKAVSAKRAGSAASISPATEAVPASRYVVFFLLAGGGFALDLVSKNWIFGRLGMPGERPTWWLWQDVFGFQTNLNEGALFGMAQGCVVMFSVLSIAAVPGILYWLFVAGAARDRLFTVTMGLVTAGILGNLYDRLGLPGLKWNFANALHNVGDPVYAVRDWILVMIGKWPWPTFNVADSLLVSGAILLIWHAFWQEAGRPAAGDRQG